MNRNQIINSLLFCSDAEADRIADRLQGCTVRIVRNDGSTEINSELRTRLQVASLMKKDATVSHVEYCFNKKWIICQ